MSDSQRLLQINQQPIENVQEYVYIEQLSKLGKSNQTNEMARWVKLGCVALRKFYSEKHLLAKSEKYSTRTDLWNSRPS